MGVPPRCPAKEPKGNLYAKLGVTMHASTEDIRAAYRKSALIHHPDRADGNHALFQEIQAAYDVLKDETKRSGYNKQLKKNAGPTTLHPGSSPLSPITLMCEDKKLRVFETHDSAFRMALRHGDLIELLNGDVGMIVGLFNSGVYWLRNGGSEAVKLADREELANPGVGGIKYKKMRSAARTGNTQRFQRPSRPAAAATAGRAASAVRKPKSGLTRKESKVGAAKKRLAAEEAETRAALEEELWKELCQTTVRFHTEWEIRSKRLAANAAARGRAMTVSVPTNNMSRTFSIPMSPAGLRRTASFSIYRAGLERNSSINSRAMKPPEGPKTPARGRKDDAAPKARSVSKKPKINPAAGMRSATPNRGPKATGGMRSCTPVIHTRLF